MVNGISTAGPHERPLDNTLPGSARLHVHQQPLTQSWMNIPNRFRSSSVYSVKSSVQSNVGSSSDQTDSRRVQPAMTSAEAGRSSPSAISSLSPRTVGPVSSQATTPQSP